MKLFQSFLLPVVVSAILTAGNVFADTKPLKVFVLVGQSNMQGHARIQTLEHIGMDPDTAPMLEQIQDASGSPRVFDDIPITYLSTNGEKKGKLTAGFGATDEKIGPELMFGITMHKHIGQPILIIKCAWGGKSIHTDFRSPSAGQYEFTESQLEQLKKRNKDIEKAKAEKVQATGHYYRLTIDHVKNTLANIGEVYPNYDSDAGYELAGFVWFQGWNDMVDRGVYPNRDQPGGYGDYSKCMAHFIRDVRKDLGAPELPFVIGVLGVNGPVSKYSQDQQRYRGVHQNFRDAMAAPADMPEFKGNVAAVLTEEFWDLELTGLRKRESTVRQELKKIQKEKKLSRADFAAKSEELMNKEFAGKEREILAKGVSNAEYHYLGSAKILSGIGKGFAEALIELSKDAS